LKRLAVNETTVGGATTDGTTDGEATAGGTAISLLQIVGYT